MKNAGRSIGIYVIVFLAVLTISMVFRNIGSGNDYKEVKFSQFASHLQEGDFEKINITDRQLTGTMKNGDMEITYAPSALEINWLEEEFGSLSEGADAMLNAEGTQYEGFRQAGVDQYSDSDPYLILPFRGEDVPWWYRTPYAFEFLAVTDDTFYQVTATGYASATNLADSEAGVSFGFCL